MLLAIVFAYLGYKRADANGRSGPLWAVILLVAFIGFQLLAGLMIGVIMGFGVAFFGWSESIFETWQWPINVVCWIVAVAACWLLLKFLDRPLKDEPEYGTPPPPPNFGG